MLILTATDGPAYYWKDNWAVRGSCLLGYWGGRWVWLQRAIAGQAVAGLAGQGYKGASWAGLQGRASWVGLQGRASWGGL